MSDNKTPSFGIYANQTDKRWNTFIEEIESLRKGGGKFPITNNQYYGFSLSGLYTHSGFYTPFGRIITLDDYFAEGSVYRMVTESEKDDWTPPTVEDAVKYLREKYFIDSSGESHLINILIEYYDQNERQKLQQEIEQLEKELQVKRDKLKDV